MILLFAILFARDTLPAQYFRIEKLDTVYQSKIPWTGRPDTTKPKTYFLKDARITVGDGFIVVTGSDSNTFIKLTVRDPKIIADTLIGRKRILNFRKY